MRFFLLPVLTGLLLLSGCGQKGPLYIPKDDAQPIASSVTNK
jgi:predicted small lipoprotein YifL